MGVIGLACANSYAMVLVSVALVGLGSAVFHPEATRMARHAAAGQQGFAQGVFQIGGHAGYAIGPLIAAMMVVPRGQTSIAWVSVVALVAMVFAWTGALCGDKWAAAEARPAAPAGQPAWRPHTMAMTVLIVLLLSKNAYTAAFILLRSA
jgi:FSR family fosmidomycin resistance protein-like MFS transporter